MLRYRVVEVEADEGRWRLLEYELGEILGPVDLGVRLLEEARDPLDPGTPLLIGLGPFTGSPIFGSNRGVVVFRSPLSMTVHVSTVGGVGFRMRGMGAHAIIIRGAASEPSVLMIVGGRGGVEEVRLEPLGFDPWVAWRRGGVYELGDQLLERHSQLVKSVQPALLAVGPASVTTRAGAIVSLHYDPKSLRVQRGFVDVAARGGPGTVLARGHNIYAILAGGSWSPASLEPRLLDRALLEKVARSVGGEPYGRLVLEKTRKYRFDEKLGTGGTFGVNWVHYRDLLPMLGYSSIYLEKVARLKLYETVMSLFWSPFQERTGRNPRNWRTCGEPCPANCKKMYNGTKVDYEPFNALGPFSGVLVFEEARRLVELADAAGVDAIEAGYWVAWVLESVARGLVEPREACLDEAPCWDPILFVEKPRECSARNARLAEKILRSILWEGGRGCPLLEAIASRGLRAAALERGEARDLVVYAAFGDRGYMTPNLYWTPGLVAPVYVTGKYWTDYHPTFMEPEEYARSAYNRILNEYSVDNAGLCRFHRGWFEKIASALYREVLGVDADVRGNAREGYRRIAMLSRRWGYEPVPWETARTRDLVATIAAETGYGEWAEKMVKEPGAPLEWWKRFKEELDKLLGL